MKSWLSRIPEQVYVFFIFFLFFALNLTSNFSGPHDSMGYLNDIEKARDLFPAHHLLYHYTSFQLFHLLRLVLPVQPYYILEIIDSFWGCLGLTTVFLIFRRRMRMTRVESFTGTAVVAFSFGMWFYCSNIEVYMPPLFFLLCGLYLCCKDQFGIRDAVMLTLVHCLAVLYHQSNVLFTPIVLWKFWDARKKIPFLRTIVAYGISSFILVAGIYFLIGWYGDAHNSPKEFYTWLRGYTLEPDYWFPLNFKTLLKALVGWGHAFFGGHFIFRVGFLQNFMTRLFYYHSLDDEAYLVRNLSYTWSLILVALTLLVCLIMLALLVRVIRHGRWLLRERHRMLIPPLMFLIIYSCFFFFWMPENLEFWIPQAGVWWIFLLGMNKQLPPPAWAPNRAVFQAVIAGLLFGINYQGSIRWMKNIYNDSVYVKIEKVKEVATDKDLIILRDPWLLDDFLEQYTPSQLSKIPSDAPSIELLNQKIDQCLATGGKVYVFTEGASMHSSKNKTFVDSLLKQQAGSVIDFDNPLTPVVVISHR